MRVLLVDDNRMNQLLGAALLEKCGCLVDVAASGAEAIAKVCESSFNVVFMDCQMPEMDGFEATQLIRKRELDTGLACPWPSPVYIIALTANAMQGDREKCLASGMDDYVSKPVRLAELQAALERWLTVQHQSTRNPNPPLPAGTGG